MTGPRLISTGGGKQSTALLVLAARRRINFTTFVMANTGDDSEHPAALKYAREVAMPYAAGHGLEFHLINRHLRDGSVETLKGRITKPGSNRVGIPVRMSNGMPARRACTVDFKVALVAKWAKEHGATAGRRCRAHRAEDKVPTGEHNGCDGACTPAAPDHRCMDAHDCDHGPRAECADCVQPVLATVGIGISTDEGFRANASIAPAVERVVYPLLGIGEETGLMMSRLDCCNLIAREPMPPSIAARLRELDERGELNFLEAGEPARLRREGFAYLPIPKKSSCFFCPFHRIEAWDAQARDEPNLFEESCRLEEGINERRAARSLSPVYLTRFNRPLREVVNRGQGVLWRDDDPNWDTDSQCDSGHCFT